MRASTKAQAKRLAFTILTALVILPLVLTACAPQAQPSSIPVEKVSLKIAVLPIIDALPLYVAQKQGYFSANNLEVTFIPAASAAERDQLITANQADGMINDLVSVALYNKQAVQVQTVAFARVADSKTAMYRVLAAKDSGLKTPADLSGVQIGMSQGTVIDYVTARLLEKEGLNPDQIKSIAVPKLPDRMALLGKGELKAATLPEPFGTIAQQAGAVLVIDDSKHPEYGNSVITFRKTVIDQHPGAIKAFLAAVKQAAADINKTPETWRSLLGEYKMVPEAVQATYPMPAFPAASIPTEAQWKDVIDWAKARKMIETDLKYGDSITGQYLP
jgi:NitT/TauT family transport system substrate-binding protein